MNLYERLVTQCQMNYRRNYSLYASKSLVGPSVSKLTFSEKIEKFVNQVREAECIIVGGASGLSAAGRGDFYYENNESYRKYYGEFEKKYGFNGAFDSMMYQFPNREEHWGYLATFLNTTQNAPIRKPYLDLDKIISGKNFHILTINQDTQFMKLYQDEQVSEIQGDHRFFQCSKQCHDETWDAIEPVKKMIESMEGGTRVKKELIPRCKVCNAEAFPWVRGYGNFLQGEKYDMQYQKISDYIEKNKDKKILFIELGVGRMTPMFIQEPFWTLTKSLPNAKYIAVNDKYDLLSKEIEDKGMVIIDNIATVLEAVREEMEKNNHGAV